MNNNVTFKSKINFVDKNTFTKTAKGIEVKFFSRNIAKGQEFFSTGIRTCTGGGVISKDKKICCGFHILNNKSNNNNITKICQKILRYVGNKPERALIIGSKGFGCLYSLENFKELKYELIHKVPNLTRFEEHCFIYSQSHIHYNLKTDTWTILTQINDGKKQIEITNPIELKKGFREIKVAKGDELLFNGEKINKEEYPEFFENSKIIDFLISYLKKLFSINRMPKSKNL